MPQGGSYTQFYLRGRNVCGCGEMNAEQQKEKVPPVWTSYVNVDNVDATAKHITEHGGRLVMPPMDVMAEGRMCVFADPTGAMLGLWQPKKHLGAGLYNEPGAFCWFELMTRDVEGAKKFYGSVFGWRYKDLSLIHI